VGSNKLLQQHSRIVTLLLPPTTSVQIRLVLK
jgi:hypothetical protein